MVETAAARRPASSEGGDARRHAGHEAVRIRPLSALAAALGACVALSACSGGRGAAGASFDPVKPGVLTVATAFLPAPGFWKGTPPADGFEARLAAALADHLGLDRVHVVQVPFAKIVAGKLGGADLALSQLTPTSERERALDFSTPYLTAPPGVLTRPGLDAPDVQSLRELRWVISRVSTLTPIVMERIRPLRAPIEVEDRSAALKVLRSGRAEALLLDLPVALGLAHDDPAHFQVVGQLDGGEEIAAALPNGSSNREVVDSAIHSLTANGTVQRLVSRWLGTSEEDVPLILTEQ